MSDLFGPAVARSTDPQTSHDAAKAVTPATPTIRQQVEAFARRCGVNGFIDEDLVKEWPSAPESSYRKRRCELTDANVILSSGRTCKNSGGMDCIIWVHRLYVTNPPAICEPEHPTAKPDSAEVARLIRELEGGAPVARQYGLIGMEKVMRDAAQLLRALT